MKAILIQTTRIALDKISSYWAGPAGDASGQVHLTLVGDEPNAGAWIFPDPGGRILATLDRHFGLVEHEGSRS